MEKNHRAHEGKQIAFPLPTQLLIEKFIELGNCGYAFFHSLSHSPLNHISIDTSRVFDGLACERHEPPPPVKYDGVLLHVIAFCGRFFHSINPCDKCCHGFLSKPMGDPFSMKNALMEVDDGRNWWSGGGCEEAKVCNVQTK